MAQVLIGISPVTLLAGTYLLVMSGFFVGFNTLLSVFLQEPVESGGYGFSAQQSAACKYPKCHAKVVEMDQRLNIDISHIYALDRDDCSANMGPFSQ
jgi:hypothetical protein